MSGLRDMPAGLRNAAGDAHCQAYFDQYCHPFGPLPNARLYWHLTLKELDRIDSLLAPVTRQWDTLSPSLQRDLLQAASTYLSWAYAGLTLGGPAAAQTVNLVASDRHLLPLLTSAGIADPATTARALLEQRVKDEQKALKLADERALRRGDPAPQQPTQSGWSSSQRQ